MEILEKKQWHEMIQLLKIIEALRYISIYIYIYIYILVSKSI